MPQHPSLTLVTRGADTVGIFNFLWCHSSSQVYGGGGDVMGIAQIIYFVP
jgi:hypothetical protein